VERRKHDRIRFAKELAVRAIGRLTWASATLCDVSIGGLSLWTQLRLRVGDEVRVSTPYAVDTGIVLTAVVRHVRCDAGSYFVGVERVPAACDTFAAGPPRDEAWRTGDLHAT
jgi:hypothetical protein